MNYNVTLWRNRVTIFAVATQQCILWVLSKCMSLSTT